MCLGWFSRRGETVTLRSSRDHIGRTMYAYTNNMELLSQM